MALQPSGALVSVISYFGFDQRPDRNDFKKEKVCSDSVSGKKGPMEFTVGIGGGGYPPQEWMVEMEQKQNLQCSTANPPPTPIPGSTPSS